MLNACKTGMPIWRCCKMTRKPEPATVSRHSSGITAFLYHDAGINPCMIWPNTPLQSAPKAADPSSSRRLSVPRPACSRVFALSLAKPRGNGRRSGRTVSDRSWQCCLRAGVAIGCVDPAGAAPDSVGLMPALGPRHWRRDSVFIIRMSLHTHCRCSLTLGLMANPDIPLAPFPRWA